MTRAEFNIRLILVFGVVFLSVIVLTIWALKGGKDFNWIKRYFLFFKIIILCLSILVNISIAFYITSGIANKTVEKSNCTVVDVVHLSSWLGLSDTYTVYLEDSDKNTFDVRTVMGAAPSFLKKVDKIKEGDQVTVKFVDNIYFLFSIEKAGQ